MNFYSYYFEELVFKFSLDRSQEANSVQWLQDEDFPPLPPRQAIALSKITLARMLESYPWAEPEFDACALTKTRDGDGEWWYYLISWMVWPPECDGGDPCQITVPVMLSGESSRYQVFKWEDRLNAWKS